MITSYATISYRPNWWIIAYVDYELGKYLRKLFSYAHYHTVKLGKPSWDEHITVVSQHEEDKIHKNLWNRHQNRSVSFNIILTPFTNGNAYWYPVESAELDEIRTELGLSNPREVPLHFAIGYLKQGKEHSGQVAQWQRQQT